jgi:hypothetical protein
MSQAREDDGKFVEGTSPDEVFELLKGENEPLTATEIADHLDISNRTALDKLNELNGREPTVIRKQVGANAVIWFIRHGAVHEQAFETFADRLTDAVGEDIERIILYGSVARGEARRALGCGRINRHSERAGPREPPRARFYHWVRYHHRRRY